MKNIKKFIFSIILFLIVSVKAQEQYLAEKYNLMPWPKEMVLNKGKTIITENFTISVTSKKGRVYKKATQFLRRLSNRTGLFLKQDFPISNTNKATIIVHFKKVAVLKIGVDESYTISQKNNTVFLEANTDIGVLRGLETLLQLIQVQKNTYFFPNITIKDAPRFIWRGLMIDASRHFEPVYVIKRNLKAMAFVKMNVFHWHLTDDQGIRFESKTYPKLQALASDGNYYTKEQIKEVVKYANQLGIRVVPEIDVPGHATAFLVAYPNLSSRDTIYTTERFAGAFNPTLNPIKDETYVFLDNLFKEITPLFPDEYFHIGGDENAGKDWDENKTIQAFKKEKGLKNNHELQTYFNIRLEKILKKYNKKLMGWDEIMTSSMPTTAVIHSWRGKHEGLKGSTLIEAAKKGYQTVLSNGYYIDRMLSVNHHYSIDPIGNTVLTKEERLKILGGEATMWGELVTPLTIDSRIWPRTAAIAERFWSKKTINNIENMRKRLTVINLQLEEVGITHLRNKEAILRNIVGSKNTQPIEILTNICEPLKVYSRNAGGTEYNTFAPFTLFADACTTDAPDAYLFNKIVKEFVKTSSKEKQKSIITFLDKWIVNDMFFQQINKNYKTAILSNLSKNLKEISILLKKGFNNKLIKNTIKKSAKPILIQLKQPIADTELMIVGSLQTLVNYLNKN